MRVTEITERFITGIITSGMARARIRANVRYVGEKVTIDGRRARLASALKLIA
jgi:hypothetical protein